MKLPSIVILQLLLWSAAAVTAEELPCDSAKEMQAYLNDVAASLSSAATAEARETTEAEAASRPNADGLDGSRLDLLRKLFVAFDLGVVEEEDGKVVFNINPDALDLDLGQFSPRLVVNHPALFAPLGEQIDQGQDALEKGLGDLDDVEAHVRWTNASGTPSATLERVAGDIFGRAYGGAVQNQFQALGGDIALATAFIRQKLNGRPLNVSEICKVPEAKSRLEALVGTFRTTASAALADLRQSLTDELFFDLADLVEGQPKLTAEGAYRRREGAAGPDEHSFSLRFEIGKASYWGWQRWAKRHSKKLDADSAQEYLREKGLDSAPTFSLTADYVDTDRFSFPLESEGEVFRQPKSHKIAYKANGGWYLGGSRSQRLVFEGSYDDVTGDPERQNRLVGTLSWVASLGQEVAKLAGGSELVVSLVWADKPEFLGEVDKDLGLRAGLKWSFDGQGAGAQK